MGQRFSVSTMEDKTKVKIKHIWEHDNNMAPSPMTLSQPHCSAVHRLATFSHVNTCEKTTALDGAHFYVFVRIRGHWRKLLQPCSKANLSSLRVPTYLRLHLPTYLPTSLLTDLPAYLPTCLPTRRPNHPHTHQIRCKTSHDHIRHMACGRGQRAEGNCQRQMAGKGHKQIQQATSDV